jgi:membrane protease YdiL (CAAX protease family)
MKGLANERNASPQARRKAGISLLAVTIILSVDYYRQLFQFPILDDLLLFLAIPLFVILLVFRENPLRYGLTLGRWREGLAWTVGGTLVMAVAAWLFWQLSDFRAYYVDYVAIRNPSGDWWRWVALSGLQMFSWEFLFRGFLLFALADLFGPYAIWIQTVPFVMAHFGKPEWETYASIAGGALSGWIAYRVGSFYPSWLIHWALAVGGWLAVVGKWGVTRDSAA